MISVSRPFIHSNLVIDTAKLALKKLPLVLVYIGPYFVLQVVNAIIHKFYGIWFVGRCHKIPGGIIFTTRNKTDILVNFTDMAVPKFYSIRQNPYECTDQRAMLEFICKNSVITCPYGHTFVYSRRVDTGKYNIVSDPLKTGWDTGSFGQDSDFASKLRINDIVVILFPLPIRTIIIAKITSDLLPSEDFSDLQVVYEDDCPKPVMITTVRRAESAYKHSRFRKEIFHPSYRTIEILEKFERDFNGRGVFDRKTFFEITRDHKSFSILSTKFGKIFRPPSTASPRTATARSTTPPITKKFGLRSKAPALPPPTTARSTTPPITKKFGLRPTKASASPPAVSIDVSGDCHR
jgi:hypothetical protein